MSVHVSSRVFWTEIEPLPYTTKGGKVQRVSPSVAKIVLLAIADSADDFGENSYNSYKTLSTKASVRPRSVIRATKALIENEYLLANGLSRYGTINFSVLFEKLGTPPKGRAKVGRPSIKDKEFLDELDQPKTSDSEANSTENKKETSDSEAETSDSEAETSDSEAETSDSEAETSDPESPYPSFNQKLNHSLTSFNQQPQPLDDEKEKRKAAGLAFTFFEENIEPITPHTSELLGELIDEHTAHWVIEAMKIAVKDQARKINYFEAILKRWKLEGYGSEKKTRNYQQDKLDSRDQADQRILEELAEA